MLRTLFAIAGLFELGRATGKNIPKVLKKSSLTVGTISTMDISVDLIGWATRDHRGHGLHAAQPARAP